MLGHATSLVGGLAQAALLGSASAPQSPVVMEDGGVTRIRLLPPGPGNPRNSEGDFIRLQDGRLLFVYTHFTGGGGDHSRAHLAGRFSSDGGRTWTATDVVILANEGEMNVMSVSLLRLKSGAIALFYLRKNSPQDCRAYLRLSTDEAASWSDPIRCIPPAGYFVVNNNRVIQLRDGRLLIPAARHDRPENAGWNPGIAVCFLSDDNGKMWRQSETTLAAPSASRSGLQEPGSWS